tara:strand:- start:10038 stop:10373 length:336 start_codon:yes stop_codon:yes gene_type:complete
MSEQKNFDYTAEKPVFVSKQPKDIKILKVRNLMPVEITYESGGVEQKTVAHVDYSTSDLSIGGVALSQESMKEISDKFFKFVYKSTALPSDLFAEERPSAPEIHKEEDVQW